MQLLGVSGEARHIYGSLGVKRLRVHFVKLRKHMTLFYKEIR